MKIIKQRALATIGWVILISGLLLYPFPIPGGSLIIIAGLVILLPNSRPAKRSYIRMQNKYGKYTGFLDSLLRRKKKVQKEENADKNGS